jgi:hypothetical protein
VIWRFETLFPGKAFSLLKKIPPVTLFHYRKKLADHDLPFLASRITARSHDFDPPRAQAFAPLRVSAKLRLPSLACRDCPRDRALVRDRVLY